MKHMLSALGLVAIVANGTHAGTPAEIIMDATAHDALEHIVRTRGFTRGVPRDAVPSPDGKRVYFLRSGPADSRQQLLVFDLATKTTRPFVDTATLGDEGTLSKEEQARRERSRQTEHGITSFQVADDGRTVLVPFSGDLFLVDVATGTPKRLTRTPEPEIDAHLAPNGERVSFLRDRDLWTVEIATAKETLVAGSTDPDVSWGAAEFIAQEEMDRRTGHWWSDDSQWLAFTRVDTHGVPRFHVPDFSDPNGEGQAEAYPKAGDPNAQVTLHIQRIGDTASQQLDLGTDIEYVARVHWDPQGTAVWVETQPRSQQRVDVRRIDLATGTTTIVWRESDRDWVNLHEDFHFLAGGASFLWLSQQTGHAHLEVRKRDGTLVRTLTSGAWDVRSVADVDEKRGTVTFSGTRDGVTEQHLYRVALAGGTIERLSLTPGWHDAAFHRQGHEIWVETYSDDRTQPKVRVLGRDGKPRGDLPSVAETPSAIEQGPVSQFMRFNGAGGEPLDVRVTLPKGDADTKSLPLIVYVYAGPGAQQVRRAWPGERGLFDGWLAQRGFAVARIDGRGVGPRGHDSERIFARRMGWHEVEDQVAGVGALAARLPQIDPNRVGVWGWSYGGYMTLMLLEHAPETFRSGVSVAPVVDWHGYDTHYTERYLGRPADNVAGYDSSSTLTAANRIRGHLTLVHGTTDDNVHFRESMLLAKKLQQLGTSFDLMVYPGTHMMETLEERMHLYTLVWRSFVAHL